MATTDSRVPQGVPQEWTVNLEHDEGDDTFQFAKTNFTQTVLASATRSATATSSAFVNLAFSGAVFFLNITSVPGSGSAMVSLVIQGQDPVSLNWAALATGGSASAVGTTAFTIYPGVTSGAASVPMTLPKKFRVMAAVSAGATSKDVVFSIGMSFVK